MLEVDISPTLANMEEKCYPRQFKYLLICNKSALMTVIGEVDIGFKFSHYFMKIK